MRVCVCERLKVEIVWCPLSKRVCGWRYVVSLFSGNPELETRRGVWSDIYLSLSLPWTRWPMDQQIVYAIYALDSSADYIFKHFNV